MTFDDSNLGGGGYVTRSLSGSIDDLHAFAARLQMLVTCELAKQSTLPMAGVIDEKKSGRHGRRN